MSKSVAILIPTWKRPDKLALCLSSILNQSKKPDKVVVVYRRVDTLGVEVIESFSERFKGFTSFKALCVETPGVIAAENAGLGLIEEDIVAFLDDDAEAPVDWVEKIIAHFERDQGIVGVGGPDLITGEKDPHYPYEKSIVGKYTFYGKVIGNHHQRITQSQNVDVLKGVNMAFLRKELPFLDTLLASEHNIGNGSQWELDICLEMRKKGTLFFDNNLWVRHNSNHDHFIELLNQRNNAHNLTYVILKHAGFVKRVVFLFYAFTIGNTQNIGLLKYAQLILKGGGLRASKLFYHSLWGTILGIKTFMSRAWSLR